MLKRFNNMHLILIMILLLVLNFLDVTAESSFAEDTFCFLSLRRNQGRSIGHVDSYSTVEFEGYHFINRNLVGFADLRAHYLDEGRFAANLGTGVRYKPCWCDQVIGINGYYDWRNIKHTSFKQVGLGLELLNCTWNFRLNGYLPIGKKERLRRFCLFDEYEGGYFILRKDFLRSRGGIDFNAEILLGRFCCTDVYMGLGAYYYKGYRCQKDIYGAEYRLSGTFCKCYALDLIATNDCSFGTKVMAQLTITIPINSENKKCVDPRMLTPIRRREIVVEDHYSRWEKNF